VVTLAGPGREDQDDLGGVLAFGAVPLIRLEREQRARSSLANVGAGPDEGFSLYDGQPGAFADLVVA
jgi:hypothetical protein